MMRLWADGCKLQLTPVSQTGSCAITTPHLYVSGTHQVCCHEEQPSSQAL
jgi:hypothetical protein